MAGTRLCLRNKIGYCKFNQACHLRHNNKICENTSCDNSCEERHPKDCWWFREFKRCKFMYCAYRHVEQSHSTDNIKSKILTLEEKIKEKEIEMKLQEQKIEKIEAKLKENNLEEKVKNLERFVLHLQEKLEKIDSKEFFPTEYDPKESGWAIFDPLVKRKSFEYKCEECDYIGRNSVRLQTHIEVKHRYYCKSCPRYYDSEPVILQTKEEFEEHNRMVHENVDEELTQEQFENLSSLDLACLRRYGRDTPRSKDVKKKTSLRLKQKKLEL